MVRIGEYSPNYARNRRESPGVSQGIFAFGEYEEKRKQYNEQRKLEYKQYMAKQALSVTPRSLGTAAKTSSNDSVITSDSCSNDGPNSVHKDVSTQTEYSERRETATNTDVSMSTKTQECSNEKQLNCKSTTYSPVTYAPHVEKKELGERNNCLKITYNYSKNHTPSGSVLEHLVQDSTANSSLALEAERDRYCQAKAAYKQELRAQVEERQRYRKDLQVKEKQEDEERERWLAEEAKKELEKRAEEENRIKALEDCRVKRMKEFCCHKERLKRESEEMRRMKMRNRIMEPQNVTSCPVSGGSRKKSGFCNEVVHQKSSESTIDMLTSRQTHKSDPLHLNEQGEKVQVSHLEEEHIGVGRQHAHITTPSRGVTPRPCLPLSQLRKFEDSPNSVAEKNQGSPRVLVKMGEIRRQLAVAQIKMEEAVKNTVALKN